LKIEKDGKLIATGTYDAETKLIKIDEDGEVSNIGWTEVHRKLGHACDRIMKTSSMLSHLRQRIVGGARPPARPQR
jgi:hypothetical protein